MERSKSGWAPGKLPFIVVTGEHGDFWPPIYITKVFQLDELSVVRSRLFEVSYSICVTVSGGLVRTTDVQAILPIRLINLLSLDPPPSHRPPPPDIKPRDCVFEPSQATRFSNVEPSAPEPRPNSKIAESFHSQIQNPGILASLRDKEVKGELCNNDCSVYRASNSVLQTENQTNVSTSILPTDVSRTTVISMGDAYGGFERETEEDSFHNSGSRTYSNSNSSELLPNEDDDVVRMFLDPVDEDAPHFADLFYASVQGTVSEVQCQGYQGDECLGQACASGTSHLYDTFATPEDYLWRRPEFPASAQPQTNLTKPNRPRGPSNFAQRVQEKMQASATHSTDRTSAPFISTGLSEDSNHGGPLVASPYTGLSSASGDNSDSSSQSESRKDLSTIPPIPETNDVFKLMDHSNTPPKHLPSSHSPSTSDGRPGGSRLLPMVPIASDLRDREVMMPVPLREASLPSSLLSDPRRASQQSDLGQQPSVQIPGTVNATVVDTFSRPSTTTPSNHVGSIDVRPAGSASSVKARIRELEEKQRVLVMNQS